MYKANGYNETVAQPEKQKERKWKRTELSRICASKISIFKKWMEIVHARFEPFIVPLDRFHAKHLIPMYAKKRLVIFLAFDNAIVKPSRVQ